MLIPVAAGKTLRMVKTKVVVASTFLACRRTYTSTIILEGGGLRGNMRMRTQSLGSFSVRTERIAALIVGSVQSEY